MHPFRPTHESNAQERKGYHHGNLKEALVQAAQRFIATRGLGGFTLADAAKIVGVTPAALYRHFSGRGELVEAIASRGFDDLGKRLAAAVAGEGTALERFTRMGEAYLDFAEKEPGYYGAMFAPRALKDGEASPQAGTGGHGSGASPDAALPPAMRLLVEALGRAFPAGFKVDPRFVALEVWALSHGLATLDAAGHLPKGPGLPDKRELLRAGVLAIVTGVQRP